MCFSVTASFGAAAFLIGIGTYTLSIARKKNLVPLAIVPLMFGVQQAIEGLIWLALAHQESSLFLTLRSLHLIPHKFLMERLSFLFLIFAYVVWPTWIPFAVYSAETNPKKATLLKYLLGLGAFISGYLLYTLLFWGATAQVTSNSISYVTYAGTPWWGIIGYAATTILPFFISSLPCMSFFGIFLALSCLAAYIIWATTFASVWCFFAALLSFLVAFVIRSTQKKSS